jgi:hypothetical protein
MSEQSPKVEPSKFEYRIGRGEQGVLTYEPYKSELLPFWRFRTVELAKKSSQDLWQKFEQYDQDGDFVGMDMSRKFIQMVCVLTESLSLSISFQKFLIHLP